MNQQKRIDLLRKQNDDLKKEIKELKSSIDFKSAKEFNELSNDMNKELIKIKEQKKELEILLSQVKDIKDALKKYGFTENGFKMPFYKIAFIRIRHLVKKIQIERRK